MDVLTEVLHVLRFQGRLFCRMELTAPWGIVDTLTGNMAQFHLVERGSCWLKVPGQAQPIALVGGDFIMVANVAELILLAEPDASIVAFNQLAPGENKRIVTHGGGGVGTTLLCGAFMLSHEIATHPLLSLLPPVIHIRGSEGSAAPWLSTIIRQVASENGLEEPGAETLVGHLIDALFIYVLRYWIRHQPHQQRGWLSGLGDPVIAAALLRMHEQPDQAWTVEALARHVGLSRSAFAARFSAVVGEPPLTYLGRWRIQLAIHHLRDQRRTLDEIAQMVGYDSVYSFSKAFKQRVGISPGRYRAQLIA
ncbi:MAG: AraC family transcriptional regulator [Pleurocapsa minor GSE-CHR-MK-17-07R]|jgi:AraC-like DNA-binding protein|nr:AraC family transcriptional regulator [Pleurocapsa minor GSE-CHR-MK 17-07R]